MKRRIAFLFTYFTLFLYVCVLIDMQDAVVAASPPPASSASSSNQGNILMNLLEEDQNMEQLSTVAVANVTNAPATAIFSYFHDGDIIALNFSQNMYIYRCEDCVRKLKKEQNVASALYDVLDLGHVTVEKSKVTQNSLWRVEHVAEGRKIRLVGDNGRYLQRLASTDSSLLGSSSRFQFLSVDALSPKAEGTVWTVVPQKRGMFSLQADNGWNMTYYRSSLCRTVGGKCLVVTPLKARLSADQLTATVYNATARDSIGIRSVLYNGGVAPIANGDCVSVEVAKFQGSMATDPFSVCDKSGSSCRKIRWMSDAFKDSFTSWHLEREYGRKNVTGVMAFGQGGEPFQWRFQVEFVGDVRNGIIRLRAVNGGYLGYAASDAENCPGGKCPWSSKHVPLRLLPASMTNGIHFTMDAKGRLKPTDLRGLYLFAATRNAIYNGLPFRTVFVTGISGYDSNATPLLEEGLNAGNPLDLVVKKEDATVWQKVLADYQQSLDAASNM